MPAMKLKFTKHALNKFKYLSDVGVDVSRQLVKDILDKPLHTDVVSDFPNKIASGRLDESHISRIVYREEGVTMVIITFYPARKGRYI